MDQVNPGWTKNMLQARHPFPVRIWGKCLVCEASSGQTVNHWPVKRRVMNHFIWNAKTCFNAGAPVCVSKVACKFTLHGEGSFKSHARRSSSADKTITFAKFLFLRAISGPDPVSRTLRVNQRIPANTLAHLPVTSDFTFRILMRVQKKFRTNNVRELPLLFAARGPDVV